MADRRSQLAAVHMAKKSLALTDESYRDLLERVTGQRSAAQLDERQLRLVLNAFGKLGHNSGAKRPPRRAGTRTLADGEQAKKARALWLNLYHLAVVRSPEEAALNAFVKRMTKRDALQWCNPEQLNRVIEALKDWCRRAGLAGPAAGAVENYDVWRYRAELPPGGEALAWQLALMEAQWKKLVELGAFRIGELAALELWVSRRYGVGAPWFLSAEQAQAAVEHLSKWLRKVAAEKAAEVNPA